MEWNNRWIKGGISLVLALVAGVVWLGKGKASSSGDGNKLVTQYAPEYGRFGEISGLIEKGELGAALAESLDVMKKSQDESLKAFTFIRIAFLYQQLGEKEKERDMWKAIEKMKGDKNFKLVEETFTCEGSTLSDYARYRLKILGS